MEHPLRCRCGTLRGSVQVKGSENHVLCYCHDCQAYAKFLGRPQDVLDSQGGSDIVQTLPAYVTITAGQDFLACMRLTPKGLVRWYARCCNTPIGNTLDTAKISFVGLVHNCLQSEGHDIKASFGPVQMQMYTESALGEPKPEKRTKMSGFARMGWSVLKALVSGSYRQTPFFTPAGIPVATPRVLTTSERQALN